MASGSIRIFLHFFTPRCAWTRDWADDANADADDGPLPRCSFALAFWSKRPQGSLPSSTQRQARPPSQQGQATNFSFPVLIYTIKGTFNSSSSGISGSTLGYLIWYMSHSRSEISDVFFEHCVRLNIQCPCSLLLLCYHNSVCID